MRWGHVVLVAVLLGACDKTDQERERDSNRARAAARVEVLLDGGRWMNTKAVGWGMTTPLYFRDRATGLCFARTFGDSAAGIATVPCGVVEGARNALLAKGWIPGTEPPPLDNRP